MRLCLCGHDTGLRHAGDGIGLKEVKYIADQDIIEAADAAAAQGCVYFFRLLPALAAEVICQPGGGDFFAFVFVLGFVVEEFVLGDDFGDGQHYDLAVFAHGAIGKFAAFEEGLYDYFVVESERFFDSCLQLVGGIHLGHPEAAAVLIGFDEEGQSHGEQLCRVVALAFKDDARCGHRDTVAAQIILTGLFVEGQGADEHIAARVGDAQQFEIALDAPVLCGMAMQHEVGQVKGMARTVYGDGEIVQVHADSAFLLAEHGPVEFEYEDLVFGRIQMLGHRSGAFQGNFALGYIAAGNHGDAGFLIRHFSNTYSC